jgi:hypothetical protein
MVRGIALLGAVAAMLAAAAPANAWWAEGGGYRSGAFGVVFIETLPGEVNDITAVSSPSVRWAAFPAPPGSVTIHDDSAPVTPPPEGRGQGCAKVDANTLTCTGIGMFDAPTDSVVYLEALLGDGDDRLRIPATSAGLYLNGDAGPGDDTILTEDTDGASVSGGNGNDRITIRGSQGAYVFGGHAINAGAGDDVLEIANLRDNEPYCGDGYDVVSADADDQPRDACEDYRVTLPVKTPSTSLPG